MRLVNKCFENVTKHFGTIVKDLNDSHNEINGRLNSRVFCYHSAQKLLYSYVLTTKIQYITTMHCMFKTGMGLGVSPDGRIQIAAVGYKVRMEAATMKI